MCTSPLWRLPDTHFNRRKLEKYASISRWVKRFRNGGLVMGLDDYAYLKDLPGNLFTADDFQMIPCSQCLDCRLKYSREWAARIMIEAKQYQFNYFVTLTYDDIHLDSLRRDIVFADTGELRENCPELSKPDLQQFMKKLRSRLQYDWKHVGVRFFGCGEYGSLNERPHFHLCLLNMPQLTDLKFFSRRGGITLYRSAFLESVWSDDSKVCKGFVTVGELTFQSAAYTARYIMKKQLGKEWNENEEALLKNGFVPRSREFILMSRRPGLAYDYYKQHKDEIYDVDKLVIKFGDVVKQLRPPKYFDYLYDIDEPIKFEQLKLSRRDLAEQAEIQISESTDLTPEERRAVRNNNLERKVKKLVREL